jgi:DNA excision repair protein ERCC-6
MSESKSIDKLEANESYQNSETQELSSLILGNIQESTFKNQVIHQAETEINRLEKERLEKQLFKLGKEKQQIQDQLNNLVIRKEKTKNNALDGRIQSLKDQLVALNQDYKFLRDSTKKETRAKDSDLDERERLIRLGKITPFDNIPEKDDDSASVQDDYIEDEDVDEFENEYPNEELEKSKQQDRYLDDGDESSYQRRLKRWAIQRHQARIQSKKCENPDDFDIELEMFKPCLVKSDVNYGPGYDLPGEIHSRLFKYQRTCIKWLFELYTQEVGGVIGKFKKH